MEPAEVTLTFALDEADLQAGVGYIDCFESLSAANRRLYRQAKKLFILDATVWDFGHNSEDQTYCTISTIPDTWVTANAHTKAFALWREMSRKVLDDSPSVSGKWRDFKVYMDELHQSATFRNNNLLPVKIKGGEWNYSDMVLPQHDVDPDTGVVEDADTFWLHMLGDDVKTGDKLDSGAVIKMYQDTRARQPDEPLVPAALATSWGTLLTDDGSQEPELVEIIDAENDFPPYDNDDYVGTGDNGDEPWTKSVMSINKYSPLSTTGGFVAPLGLLRISTNNTSSDSMYLKLTIAPGFDRGIGTQGVRQ